MRFETKQKEQERMSRVWDIYRDSVYQDCLKKNEEYEKDRIYCRHGYDHLLAVARLAYLFSLERGYDLEKDLIYAAALLHDVGRWKQYADGTPHDEAGALIGEGILSRTGFDDEEKQMITAAIRSHRGAGASVKENDPRLSRLQEVLYDADKMSRDCYACDALDSCNWAAEKKNLQIMW